MPVVLTHVVGTLPQFGAQLNKLQEMQSSFFVQSFILRTIAEYNKVSEKNKILASYFH